MAGFKKTLNALSQDRTRRYIGVFVAWRGQVIPGDLFSSYWNRRDAANRIAGPSMTEALFRLMFATRPQSAWADPCAQEGPADPAHFVIIGHSFGGRILERAVAQPYMAMLAEMAARNRPDAETRMQPPQPASSDSARPPI